MYHNFPQKMLLRESEILPKQPLPCRVLEKELKKELISWGVVRLGERSLFALTVYGDFYEGLSLNILNKCILNEYNSELRVGIQVNLKDVLELYRVHIFLEYIPLPTIAKVRDCTWGGPGHKHC